MRIGEIERIGERELPQWGPNKEPAPLAQPLPEKEPEEVPEKVN